MPSEPDRVEKAIRFGCGALFGLFFGFVAALKFAEKSYAMPIAIAGVVALVFGLLAMRIGDRFWQSIRNLFWFS